jgi:hypothetical protein
MTNNRTGVHNAQTPTRQGPVPKPRESIRPVEQLQGAVLQRPDRQRTFHKAAATGRPESGPDPDGTAGERAAQAAAFTCRATATCPA